jgi:hypothetical protein
MDDDRQLPATLDLKLIPVLTKDEARHQLKEFNEFVKEYLVPGQDIIKISGVQNEILSQAGAQKLAEIYGLYPEIETVSRIEDWDREPPLFDYTLKVVLKRRKDDCIVGAGIGSCNSWEAKYKWREAKRTCPNCQKPSIKASKREWGGGFYCDKNISPDCGSAWKGQSYQDNRGNTRHPTEIDKEICAQIAAQAVGKVPNDDIASQKNTVLKMAKKRAYVDAVISATRSSGIFTQDVEDFVATIQDSETQIKADNTGTSTVDVETGEVKVPLATKEDLAGLIRFGKQYGIAGTEVQTLCMQQEGIDQNNFFGTFTLTHLAQVKAAIIEASLDKSQLLAKEEIPF